MNKVLAWSRQQESLRIVDDQVGSPTWARILAEATAQVLARGGEYVREHAGLYHLAGSGFASRLEWARRILEDDPHPDEQVTKELLPGLTSDFPTNATRAPFSALDCGYFQNTFRIILPEWEQALSLAMR